METNRSTFIAVGGNNGCEIILNRDYISHIAKSNNLPNVFIINMANGDKFEIDKYTFEEFEDLLKK